MMKPGLKKRLMTGGIGLMLLLGILASAFTFSVNSGTAHAAVSPSSHSMSVHPLYRYAGKANAADPDVTFSCQKATAAVQCYSPQALLKAYGIQPVLDAGITGKGKTIVIIDAFGSPTVQEDLDLFSAVFGIPSTTVQVVAPFGLLPFDPNDDNMVGWSGEIALDVESAHAVAPGAKIVLAVSKTNDDADIQKVLDYVVDHRLGDVISQSYGEAESCVDPKILKAQHRAFQKAVLKGITVFASSGDDGAAQPSCDGTTLVKEASSPASDPLVTSVGGTHLVASQPDGTYSSETAWNDEFGSSGGGYSKIYSRPFFQNGYVKNKARGVPDVAYSGDVNGGLLIAWSAGDIANLGSIWIFGGTSAGSPQWAAMAALVDSKFGPQGDINPLLYQIVARVEYSKVFHDVTVGNNTVTEEDADGNLVTITGFPATPKWDAVTGLGSIDLSKAILNYGKSCWSKTPITY